MVQNRIDGNRSQIIRDNAPEHWGNPVSLEKHLDDHGKDFGIKDPFEYTDAANRFKNVDTPEAKRFTDKDGVEI